MFRKLLKPLNDRITSFEKGRKIFSSGREKNAETSIKNHLETLSQKLEQNISGKLVSDRTLDDFVIKLTNLTGLAEDPRSTTKKR